MKNRIIILVLSTIFIVQLVGCNEDTTLNSSISSNVDTTLNSSTTLNVDTSLPNVSFGDMSTVSDSSSGDLSTGADSSSDKYTEKYSSLSYEDFWSDFPEFHGKWIIIKYCTSARVLNNNCEFIFENCPGEALEFTEEGIEFLNNLYSQYSKMPSSLDLYSKSEICSYSGYLEYDKVPLSGSSEKIYEYFTLSIIDENLALNDLDNFNSFYLCIYENDKLFIGIDNVFYTAQRLESVHSN